MDAETLDNRGFFQALFGDGRPLLSLTGLCLILSGGFALMQSASGHFLPHDVQYLGMTAEQLCSFNQCKVVHFMFHDRVSFGGAIMGIGIMYLWLAEFPLKQRRAWAWWVFAISGGVGFASFLSYLGYGYFDSWHGVATMLLFPCFVFGLILSWKTLDRPRSIKTLLQSGVPIAFRTRFDIGRNLLLVVSFGLICAGLVILTVGATIVFVPTDLTFMGLKRAELHAINPRLIPLIAHDRAGFGGGVCSGGLALFLCIWCSPLSRSLWQALLLAGTAGFTTAIAIHPVIGYTDLIHLAPAILGAVLFALGLAMTFRRVPPEPVR
jgi:MFS family permease